jgi:diguanylate cyclase (GGDEF)-like protein/PAS domain S-box-containing protein
VVTKPLPLRARVYVGTVIAAGVALLLLLSRPPEVGQFAVLAGLVVATIASSALKLNLPTTGDRATVSAAFVIDFAALILFGPNLSMWIATIGAIGQSTLHVAQKNPLHRTLFNAASLVVTMQASGVVYVALGGHFGGISGLGDAAPLTGAVLAYFLVNSGLVAAAIALSTSQPVLQVWQHNFLWSAPSYFVSAGVAILIVEGIARQMWGFLPLAALAAYLTYRAHGVYVARLQEDHRHREVIESLNEAMAVIQRDGRVTLWNEALERTLGVPRQRALGRPLLEAVPGLAATALPALIGSVGESGRADSIEQLVFERNGERRILQIRLFPFLSGVTVFWNDITDRADSETALNRSEERYALAAAGANDGLWDWDLEHDTIYFSPRWNAMVGLAADTAHFGIEHWFGRVHPDDLAALRAALDAHLAGQTTHFQHEHRIAHEDGTYRAILCRGVAVRAENGRPVRVVGSQTDVTERTAVLEQLRHAALHDTLTDLPNRALFMELLGQVLDRSRRHRDHLFAVLFLDIDRFKVVNDSLGHQVGDDLLVAISRRIESCLRSGDAIARLGGDEFTILLNDLSEPSRASLIAQRIHDVLQRPFAPGGHEIYVTASIGIALSVAGYSTPDQIMRDADTAMYRAKTLGKARYEVYDGSNQMIALGQATERLGIENDLRRAIDHGNLVLHYQPIASLPSGEWTGFKTLVRWHLAGREVPQDELVAMAEETGMIAVFGDWVMRKACGQIAAWHIQFPHSPNLGVTVAVATPRLVRPDFVASVRQIIEEAGTQPSHLCLEITTPTLVDKPELAAAVLHDLRTLGVRVSLDDGGAGFRSLTQLHRFPISSLKIDRSLVSRISGSDTPQERLVVENIVALAKTVGAGVIAEGVETAEQLRELLRLGCHEAHGHFFTKPLPPIAAEAVLAAYDGRAAVSRAATPTRVVTIH